MNYEQTIVYMFKQLPMFTRIGAAAYKADLSITIELNKAIGNPEKRFPSVHIAGTNGKGSVSNMMASVLQEAGYKTALFTSPHLKDFRERIRINGIMIPEEKVVEFVEDYRLSFEIIKPSFFEMTFAMACWYFAQQKVEIAVMETGMGGRLDSTNTVKSVLSIITNIGMDHMQFLGDTLPKIAFEKAGIIRNNIPVIIGEHQLTDDVFITEASKKNSPITFATDVFSYQSVSVDSRNGYLKANVLKNNNLIFSDLKIPLAGNYQKKNLLTAIAGIDHISGNLYDIDKAIIIAGLQNVVINTGFRGRWQVLSSNPLIICDTAHNAEGIKEVMQQLQSVEFNNLHMVLGMVSDKDVEKILTLFPSTARYYFCKPDIPRGLDVSVLQNTGKKFGLFGEAFHSVQMALTAARMSASEKDCIFVGGSTFVVAEI